MKSLGTTRAGIVASLALGISIYLKPTQLIVAFALLLLLSLRQLLAYGLKALNASILIPFSLIAILLAPWVARNLLVMQAFIPLTTSNGSNLYGGNNPDADGGYVSSEPYVLPNLSETESDRILTDRAMDWIRSNPGDFVKLLPAKAARYFWPLSLGTSGYFPVPKILSGITLIILVAFYALVLLGARRLVTTKRLWELALLGTTPILLLLLTLVTFGGARFSLPAFPALAVLASLGGGTFLARQARTVDSS